MKSNEVILSAFFYVLLFVMIAALLLAVIFPKFSLKPEATYPVPDTERYSELTSYQVAVPLFDADIIRFHDNEKNVDCWIYQQSISCVATDLIGR